jgi:acetyl esterase/lipase
LKNVSTQLEDPPVLKSLRLCFPLLTLALFLADARADDTGWVPLFDGKTFDGWTINGGTAAYKVEDGAIVGTTVEGSPNTFLCKGDFTDFELELEVMCDPALNSGIQVRSHVYAKDDPNPENAQRAGVVYGPQCEIANKETGTAGRFYDEGRRGMWLDELEPGAKDAFHDDGWNRYKIVVQGNRYQSWINGIAASDFTDDMDKHGFIGLQVHGIAKGSGPFSVRWKNIRIRELKPGDSATAEPKILRDVPYAGTTNPKQTLDVYAPREGNGHAILFWIHGGGWEVGDKIDVAVKPRALVDKGYVFVSTNYRLLPEASIGEMAGDIAKAIRWVHDHAAEFGGDGGRMVVAGHSAGAQLAALLCIDDRYITAEGVSPSIIKGCVPVDGDTYDVPMQIATVNQRTADIYRKKFGQDEATQKDLSPVTHVVAGKPIPPVLILHVAEHPETRGQSQRLAKALNDAGFHAIAYPATGKNHSTLNDGLGSPDDKPTEVLYRFLDTVLHPVPVK